VATPVPTASLRPFRRITVTAGGEETLDEFVEMAQEKIRTARSIPEQAVVELHLGGVASFRRQDLPIEALKGAVEAQYDPLVARVRNSLTPPGTVSVRHGERLPRAELERQVVERMLYAMADYRDVAGVWAKVILDVKNMAVEKNLPADIAEHVQSFLHRAETPGEVLPPAPEPIEIEGE
jgi:hypothetical protein